MGVSRVTWSRPALVSWHRGGRELAEHASPEAFLSAIAHQAELIEVDVRATADGYLICWHDETTPDGVPVHAQTFDAVRRQSKVWRWDDFVDALSAGDPDRTIGVHLDLKATGYELAAVDPLINLAQPFFVTTLEQSSILLLRQARPDEDAFLTIGRAREERGSFSYLVLRLSELLPMFNVSKTGATGVAIHHHLLRRHIAWWLRRRSLRVVVWTVNSSAGLETAFRNDTVDAVTTNFPLKALRLRQQLVSKGR